MKPGNIPQPIRDALRALERGAPREAEAYVASLKNSASEVSIKKQVKNFVEILLSGKSSKRRSLWYQSFRRQPAWQGKITTPYQPIQYWSQGSPPDDVVRITNLWNELLREIGLAPILLFDKVRAEAWIATKCAMLLDTFRSAYDYAAEADVFRVAYASQCDTVWIDADLYPKDDMVSLLHSNLRQNDLVFFYRWYAPRISNAFFASKADCPFFPSFAESMKNYRYSKDAPSQTEIITAFGPTRFNSRLLSIVRDARSRVIPPARLSFVENERNYSIGFVNERVFAYMTPPDGLQYKKSDEYWKRLPR